MDNAEEREFIYNFAKKLYESDYLGVIHSYDYDIRESAEKIHSDKANVVGKEELLNILETKTGIKVEEKEFTITLSDLEFKKNGKKPELFGVYLLVENDGRLSVGCWREPNRKLNDKLLRLQRRGNNSREISCDIYIEDRSCIPK